MTADGMSKPVDFVLVWMEDQAGADAQTRQIRREIYERNLVNEGLELSYETLDKFHVVKIYAPVEVLTRFCEILKLKMPIKIVSRARILYFF